MSSCMASVPYAFQAGGECAGFGTCVNSTRTPGLSLCKCFAGHSGASDFFDNRVEQLPDGTWLSYSCNESSVGTYIIWSLFCLVSVVRVIQIFPVWLHFYRKHYGDPAKVAEGVWRDAPLRIVSLDLVGLSTLHLITGLCKLGGLTFGTDVLPTVTLCGTVLIFQIVIFDLSRTEFDIFVQGTTNPSEAEKAKRLRMYFKCCCLSINFLSNTVASLWTLSTDKSKGPLLADGGGEELAIYFRNIGALAFAIGESWSTWMIRKRITQMQPCASGNSVAVAYIVGKMDAEMKQYVIFASTIGVAYAIFSIPFLFPYQSYLICFIVLLGGLRHTGKALASERDVRRKTTVVESRTGSSAESKTRTTRADRNSETKDRRKLTIKCMNPSGSDTSVDPARQDSTGEFSQSVASRKQVVGAIIIDSAEASPEATSCHMEDPRNLTVTVRNVDFDEELTRKSNLSFTDNENSPRASVAAITSNGWSELSPDKSSEAEPSANANEFEALAILPNSENDE